MTDWISVKNQTPKEYGFPVLAWNAKEKIYQVLRYSDGCFLGGGKIYTPEEGTITH